MASQTNVLSASRSQRFKNRYLNHQDIVARLSLDELSSGTKIKSSTFNRLKLSRALRYLLPYGLWTCADGRQVWFSRSYVPLFIKSPGGHPIRADHHEHVEFISQEYFYVDADFRDGWRAKLKELVAKWIAILGADSGTDDAETNYDAEPVQQQTPCKMNGQEELDQMLAGMSKEDRAEFEAMTAETESRMRASVSSCNQSQDPDFWVQQQRALEQLDVHDNANRQRHQQTHGQS